jgi:multidrug efflux pump subunit AcrA (membrane-fusion protein)
MYANVTLKVDQRPHALAIPIEAVSPGSKTVLVVTAAHQVEEHPIKLGLETANQYEVLSGLSEGDLVMMGNPGQLTPGQKVEPRISEPVARQ